MDLIVLEIIEELHLVVYVKSIFQDLGVEVIPYRYSLFYFIKHNILMSYFGIVGKH